MGKRRTKYPKDYYESRCDEEIRIATIAYAEELMRIRSKYDNEAETPVDHHLEDSQWAFCCRDGTMGKAVSQYNTPFTTPAASRKPWSPKHVAADHIYGRSELRQQLYSGEISIEEYAQLSSETCLVTKREHQKLGELRAKNSKRGIRPSPEDYKKLGLAMIDRRNGK